MLSKLIVTLIASIRKRPGEGKKALLALLSVAEVKLAIVTDDDIDIFDPDSARRRAPGGLPVSPLADRLVADLRARPQHFAELVEAHPAVAWLDFLRAWGEVRESAVLGRDDHGRYVITTPAAAAAS